MRNFRNVFDLATALALALTPAIACAAEQDLVWHNDAAGRTVVWARRQRCDIDGPQQRAVGVAHRRRGDFDYDFARRLALAQQRHGRERHLALGQHRGAADRRGVERAGRSSAPGTSIATCSATSSARTTPSARTRSGGRATRMADAGDHGVGNLAWRSWPSAISTATVPTTAVAQQGHRGERDLADRLAAQQRPLPTIATR